MKNNNNLELFFALVRAGLWGQTEKKESSVSHFKFQVSCDADWGEVYRLAEDQSVIGLVAAGAESTQGSSSIPRPETLRFIGQTLQIEQRNKAMNTFVAELISLLRENDIYAILVKGQGIAQCYEKPLWRASGDVDLLLNDSNYEKAKKLLVPLASHVETEYSHFKHMGMTIDGWEVELHGTLHSRLSKRVDNVVDEVQGEVFYGGKVRSWMNGRTQVFLPAPDCDVVFLFTHILHHYFFEGIGLRQFCDLCRFLWVYRDALNVPLLEKHLREMRLMTEWKTLAAFAVDYLGMPVEAMPLYSADKKWKKKGDRMCRFVIKVGNFGHKQRRNFTGMSYLKQKIFSFWGRLNDMLRHFTVFPMDSIRFFGGVLRSGLHAAVRGE